MPKSCPIWMQPSLGQLRQLRNINNLGITGFAGVGGLSGCHNPKVKAGLLTDDWWVSPPPKHPVDIAAELKCQFWDFGGNDDGIPVATVEQMRKALKAGAILRCHLP